jgi:hypothetical protein
MGQERPPVVLRLAEYGGRKRRVVPLDVLDDVRVDAPESAGGLGPCAGEADQARQVPRLHLYGVVRSDNALRPLDQPARSVDLGPGRSQRVGRDDRVPVGQRGLVEYAVPWLFERLDVVHDPPAAADHGFVGLDESQYHCPNPEQLVEMPGDRLDLGPPPRLDVERRCSPDVPVADADQGLHRPDLHPPTVA